MNTTLAKAYLKHFLTARHRHGHGIHSPFLYDLISETIEDFTPFYCFERIENMRKTMLESNEFIQVSDFGAGSQKFGSDKRKISDIARYSTTNTKYAQLLFRLVRRFQAKNILELGTSLGITSMYLASVSNDSKVYTIEGCPEIATTARKIFSLHEMKNIFSLSGRFDDVLPGLFPEIGNPDFVFFDGNHQKDATLRYFNLCKKYISEKAVFVFDDIHWSDGMEQAWLEIKKDDSVRITLDVLQMGIVFFNPELQKQDFVLRF